MKFKRFFKPVRVPKEIIPEEYGEVDYPAIKKVLLEALERDWGPRCVTKDFEDFPELHDDIIAVGDDAGRCPCCVVYERFDRFWSYFSPDEVS